MSWFSNTLFPVIEDVFSGTDLPANPKDAAQRLRDAGFSKEADYVSTLDQDGLREVYDWSNVLPDEEDVSWQAAESAWGG